MEPSRVTTLHDMFQWKTNSILARKLITILSRSSVTKIVRVKKPDRILDQLNVTTLPAGEVLFLKDELPQLRVLVRNEAHTYASFPLAFVGNYHYKVIDVEKMQVVNNPTNVLLDKHTMKHSKYRICVKEPKLLPYGDFESAAVMEVYSQHYILGNIVQSSGSSDTQSIVIPKYSSIEVEEAKKLRRTPNVKLIQFLDKYRGIYSIANYSRLPLAIEIYCDVKQKVENSTPVACIFKETRPSIEGQLNATEVLTPARPAQQSAERQRQSPIPNQRHHTKSNLQRHIHNKVHPGDDARARNTYLDVIETSSQSSRSGMPLPVIPDDTKTTNEHEEVDDLYERYVVPEDEEEDVFDSLMIYVHELSYSEKPDGRRTALTARQQQMPPVEENELECGYEIPIWTPPGSHSYQHLKESSSIKNPGTSHCEFTTTNVSQADDVDTHLRKTPIPRSQKMNTKAPPTAERWRRHDPQVAVFVEALSEEATPTSRVRAHQTPLNSPRTRIKMQPSSSMNRAENVTHIAPEIENVLVREPTSKFKGNFNFNPVSQPKNVQQCPKSNNDQHIHRKEADVAKAMNETLGQGCQYTAKTSPPKKTLSHPTTVADARPRQVKTSQDTLRGLNHTPNPGDHRLYKPRPPVKPKPTKPQPSATQNSAANTTLSGTTRQRATPSNGEQLTTNGVVHLLKQLNLGHFERNIRYTNVTGRMLNQTSSQELSQLARIPHDDSRRIVNGFQEIKNYELIIINLFNDDV